MTFEDIIEEIRKNPRGPIALDACAYLGKKHLHYEFLGFEGGYCVMQEYHTRSSNVYFNPFIDGEDRTALLKKVGVQKHILKEKYSVYKKPSCIDRRVSYVESPNIESYNYVSYLVDGMYPIDPYGIDPAHDAIQVLIADKETKRLTKEEYYFWGNKFERTMKVLKEDFGNLLTQKISTAASNWIALELMGWKISWNLPKTEKYYEDETGRLVFKVSSWKPFTRENHAELLRKKIKFNFFLTADTSLLEVTHAILNHCYEEGRLSEQTIKEWWK